MERATLIEAPEDQVPPGRRHRRRRWFLVAAAAAVAVLAVAAVAGHVYTDWLWFGEVGLRAVFWKRFVIALVLWLLGAGVFFAIVYGSVEIARRLAPRYRPVEGVDVLEVVHESAHVWTRRLGLVVATLGALIAGSSAAGAWLLVARYLDGVPFGVRDPIFHNDLSLYVFRLPLWQGVIAWLFGALIVALIVSVLAHLALGGLEILSHPPRVERTARELASIPPPVLAADAVTRVRGLRAEPRAVAHISALVAALFVVGAVGYLLRVWALLYSTAGVVFGAGYTDVHVRLPLLYVMAALCLALAAALVYNAVRRRSLRWLPLAFGVWLAAFIVLLGIVPAAFQALVVNPNQLVRERPYLTYNLAATRNAYSLTAVEQTPYPLGGDLSAAKLRADEGTVRNIRLWDPQVLLRSYGQLQELRPYYSFTTVGVDRYQVNGVYTQTMLAPRELRRPGLPPQAQTWVNQHLTYTHGYGVALSAVNQVASGGTPDFLVQDVPTVSSAPTLAITQPRIYYGLLGADYVLVRTRDLEFDYPGPKGDVYTRYAGSGGIPISSWLDRLAFTLRFADLRFLTTTSITAGSRVIIYDELRARLAAAAPFLQFDRDPYMVIAGGRLFWIADAYTTTRFVPYSQPNGGLNYIRNSVKVVVDAFNGSMAFYVFDSADPLLRTYERMFPGMFRPASAMPATLLSHVRYPQDLFSVQSQLFETYHVTDPGLLYNKGDQWAIPSNVSISGSGPMSAYYMIMRLPGQTSEEFVLILPFVPNDRPNMIAWLGAESDAPNYGRAVSFTFPADRNVYGPAQVEAAINQDPTISAQRTLWGQQGSHVIFGNLLTVPIADSMLYVQPLYLQSNTTRLPQIQRVIVFYRSASATPRLPTGQQQNVVMAPTLGEALAAIFGGGQGGGQGGGTAGPVNSAAARLIARANALYGAAQAALRAGDLVTFGRQIEALGRTLEQLKAVQ
jgi:uncharacterized membrane protein (UPF0182 family)